LLVGVSGDISGSTVFKGLPLRDPMQGISGTEKSSEDASEKLSDP
jgi:hypothetical protein